jgi:osmotically-inducible protein OsmY
MESEMISTDDASLEERVMERMLGVLAVTVLGLSLSFAQSTTSHPATSSTGDTGATAPDNTGVNKRDRSKSEPTADQQKENKSDRELARNVRRSLVKDKSLSSYAHNIKVVAQDGKVILKGPVRSAEEKQAIETKAAEVAGGADKVNSEIEVASKSGKPSADKSSNQ